MPPSIAAEYIQVVDIAAREVVDEYSLSEGDTTFRIGAFAPHPYEPKAIVYHFHGIHQDGNIKRLNNVINIIETSQKKYKPGKINPKRKIRIRLRIYFFLMNQRPDCILMILEYY